MKAVLTLRWLMLISALFITICSTSQDLSISYVYPVDGSENINPEQNIILRNGESINPETITNHSVIITGSISGHIQSNIIISEDLRTIIFKPVHPFQLGERVNVSYAGGIRTKNNQKILPFESNFEIIHYNKKDIYDRLHRMDQDSNANTTPLIPAETAVNRDNHLPSDYPAPTVNSYGPQDDEYIFINMVCRNAGQPWANYLTILDSYGTPIFYDKSQFNRNNFGVLPNGLLCYAINNFGNNEREKYFIMDSAYRILDSVNTGNGYILDSHDMLLLANGHYLVMSYDPQPVDMSQVVAGGNPNAIVTGLVIQEVDNTENVFFQWRSWDHFQITDATSDINLTAMNIDYVHGNALEIDFDGNILLSSRHLDEITKINFTNGEIIWRFGLNSENNDFTISNDPTGFSHQHDIRRLPNGHYTLFDNGNLKNPPFSQVLEYEIDQINLTAVLLGSYQHSPQIYTQSTGSFRTQSNGDRVIGWGSNSPLAITELKANNSLLREYLLPDFVTTYRAIKAPWKTNLFTTQELLSLGNSAAYTKTKKNYLYIDNPSDQNITISSIHHHDPVFDILSDLPIAIAPNSSAYIEIGFNPTEPGIYQDRFTLNYDNLGNTRRIARQLSLEAINNDDVPSVFFNPLMGAENVDPNTEIIIGFSESVRKVFGGEIQDEEIPTLIDLKLINREGEDLSFTGHINESKTEIIIYPDQILAENTQHYVLLKHGVLMDYDNNIISLEEETYFTTGMLTDMKEKKKQLFEVYPNPFTQDLHIENPGELAVLISIYNGSGKLIFTAPVSENTIDIKTDSYPPGVYFISLIEKGSQKSMVVKTIKF